jgi:hypothetical protein
VREKPTRRPERVVSVAGGGAMSWVALAKGLKVVLPQSASFSMTLSADTVTGLPRTRSCSVFSFREDMIGEAVRGLQSSACCVLTEKDKRAVTEVLVHECGRGGAVRCRNWSEAGHMTAQLCHEMCWFHWVRCSGR